MKKLFVILIIYLFVAIPYSSAEEEELEENKKPKSSVSSSYTYSIEYDDSNHGNYGHKIHVKDGSATVNVHAHHPKNTQQAVTTKQQETYYPESIKEQNPKQLETYHSEPVKQQTPKQQEVVYVPDIQNVIPQQQPQKHQSEHQQNTIQQGYSSSASKLNVPSPEQLLNTYDQNKLAALLAQNKNPFFQDSKVAIPQSQAQYSKPVEEIPQNPSYYIPQPQVQYTKDYVTQVPATKSATTPDSKLQYNLQYTKQSSSGANIAFDPKVQFTSIQQPSYYYPSNSIGSPSASATLPDSINNQFYQTYYQNPPTTTSQHYSIPQATHLTNSPNYETSQQFVYAPQQTAHLSQPSVGTQYQIPQAQTAQVGPVQFTPQNQQHNLAQSVGKQSQVQLSDNSLQSAEKSQIQIPSNFLQSFDKNQFQTSSNVFQPSQLFYNYPKDFGSSNLVSTQGAPEIATYPSSLFENIQYSNTNLQHGSVPANNYKPIFETQSQETVKSQYAVGQGISGHHSPQTNQGYIPRNSHKPASTTQDSKYINVPLSNVPLTNPENLYKFVNFPGYKPTIQSVGFDQNKFVFNNANLNQGKPNSQGAVTNPILNVQPQKNYVHLQQNLGHLQKNYISPHSQTQQSPANYQNVGAAPQHSNIKYVYVPTYPSQYEQNKGQ